MVGVDQLSEKLRQEMEEFKTIQAKIVKMQKSQQAFISQLNENIMVKKEFDLLEEDAKVFKLMGPVLVPQDTAEAKGNVEKRIEFIEAEVKRVQESLKVVEKEQDAKKDVIVPLQNQIQAMQQAAAAK